DKEVDRNLPCPGRFLQQRQFVITPLRRSDRDPGRTRHERCGFPLNQRQPLLLLRFAGELRTGAPDVAHNFLPPVPRNANNVPSSITPAATVAEVHPLRRYIVGTSGCGGGCFPLPSPRRVWCTCCPPAPRCPCVPSASSRMPRS